MINYLRIIFRSPLWVFSKEGQSKKLLRLIITINPCNPAQIFRFKHHVFYLKDLPMINYSRIIFYSPLWLFSQEEQNKKILQLIILINPYNPTQIFFFKHLIFYLKYLSLINYSRMAFSSPLLLFSKEKIKNNPTINYPHKSF